MDSFKKAWNKSPKIALKNFILPEDEYYLDEILKNVDYTTYFARHQNLTKNQLSYIFSNKLDFEIFFTLISEIPELLHNKNIRERFFNSLDNSDIYSKKITFKTISSTIKYNNEYKKFIFERIATGVTKRKLDFLIMLSKKFFLEDEIVNSILSKMSEKQFESFKTLALSRNNVSEKMAAKLLLL